MSYRTKRSPFIGWRQRGKYIKSNPSNFSKINLDILILKKQILDLISRKTKKIYLYFQYDVEHDPEEEQAFNSWLQCYYKDGMQNLVDHNGRTIWFSGPPGPMKPSNSKSRGKRTSKSDTVKKEVPNEDHDYAPKKPKKTKKEETPKRPIKTEKADKTTSNQNRRKTRSSKD